MNPVLLLARFETSRDATKVQRILGKMYAAHRVYVTARDYGGPELAPGARLQPSPPMRAVGAANGFTWPDADGISVEPDSEGRFTVARIGSAVVVHHPYALQFGEAGIRLLAERHGAQRVATSAEGGLHVRVTSRSVLGRKALAAITDFELPEATTRHSQMPARASLVLELADAHGTPCFLRFEETIGGHEDFVAWLLDAGRRDRAQLAFEIAPSPVALARLTLREHGVLRTVSLEALPGRGCTVVSPPRTEVYPTLSAASAALRRELVNTPSRIPVVQFTHETISRLCMSLFREACRAGFPMDILSQILSREPTPSELAIERAPAHLLALAAHEPDLNRRIALTAPLSPTELADLVEQHTVWLRTHRDHLHVWIPMRVSAELDLSIVTDALDDPSRTSLSRRDMRGLDFRRLDLAGVQMASSIADGVDFGGANLSLVYAAELRAPGAIFDGATLREADLSRADFTNASFKNADCTGVDFQGCIVDGADFTGADLTDALHAPSK